MIYSSYLCRAHLQNDDLECVLPILVGFDISDNDCEEKVICYQR